MTFQKVGSFIIYALLLSGCVPTEVIDELQLIHTSGFDYIDEDVTQVTVSIPKYIGADQKTSTNIESETITASGTTAKGIRDKLDSKSPKIINNSKLSSVVYNQELAEKGIYELIDTYSRDPSVGQRMHLLVYEGNTKELLESHLSIEPEISRYISELVEQNTKHTDLPKTNIHVFLYRYHQDGMDAFLPYLGMSEDKLQVKGLAIFKDDKMVSSISMQESFLFKALVESFSEGTYEIKLEGNEYATFMNLIARTKYKLHYESGKPVLTAKVTAKGSLSEYSGGRLDEKKIKEFEDELTEQLKEEIKALIKKFQYLDADPLGLGFQVKTRTRGWNAEKWSETYPDLKVNVEVNTTITHGGISE
ncbi:Ger(x)C family spore germination protein [Alteribacter keqinensis]|uniref:Ger(X)C family spore germination protein n=1 Tax=Alteribacter keqinensis TaxID=2483800 RepID=A0A3M7TUP1_9BACI|nr:Ger(x)C family spore germination protein [Alteribacter keqinensis]RNA69368.1 Ger(x)C family spore germination protein [Alteribacter keqinensis]